ncbi:MAG: hypothetical protein K2J31_00680 [Alistipes sp.]|nr:hypothetical protein [Alistipes sp.]
MKRYGARRLGRYAAFAALWVVLAAIFFAARRGAADHRAVQRVEDMRIEVDGRDAATFLSEETVRDWVLSYDCNPLGLALKDVDMAALESSIEANDAVADANVYLTSGGRVEIDVRQRRPLMRLMVDGYDLYVAADGYVFAAPPRSAIYVPVVTGDYRPLFGAAYSGHAHAMARDSIARIEERIDAWERDKMPLYRALQQCSRAMKKLSSQRASKGWFTSDEEYAVRCEQLELYKAQRRGELTAEAKSVQGRIDDLTRNQEGERKRQKKLEKIEEDFSKLINFVDIIQHDDFWRSEIVQIVAHGGGERELEIELIPRSGRHTIIFGRADDIERKLSDLDAFYRNVLTNVGWDKYRTVSVKYKGQVVCR